MPRDAGIPSSGSRGLRACALIAKPAIFPSLREGKAGPPAGCGNSLGFMHGDTPEKLIHPQVGDEKISSIISV